MNLHQLQEKHQSVRHHFAKSQLDAAIRKQIKSRVGACIESVGTEGQKVLHDFFYTDYPESFAQNLLDKSVSHAEMGIPFSSSLSQSVPVLDDQDGVQYLQVYPVTDAYDAGLISDEDIERTIGRIQLVWARWAYEHVHKKPHAVHQLEDRAFLAANRKIGKLFPGVMGAWVMRLNKKDLAQRGLLPLQPVIENGKSIEEIFAHLDDGHFAHPGEELEHNTRYVPETIAPGTYRAFPDHLPERYQASLAWGIANDVFSKSEIEKIHFDHGDTADTYVQGRSDLIDTHWEGMRKIFIDGYKIK